MQVRRRQVCGTKEVALVALRDIAASEVLSFDYVTTEWDMDRYYINIYVY